jgi:uncharacterized membrane protein
MQLFEKGRKVGRTGNIKEFAFFISTTLYLKWFEKAYHNRIMEAK